jgi:hypothetical protein
LPILGDVLPILGDDWRSKLVDEKQHNQIKTMKLKTEKRLWLMITLAAAIAATATNVKASSAATIEGQTANTAATYDNASGAYPVVNAILSSPVGALDGYTYSSYAFLAADSTGSLDIFYNSSVSSYAPTLGDGLSVAGTWSPFDGIPEVENSGAVQALSITKESSGNSYLSPMLVTIPTINVTSETSTGVINTPYAGYYLQLNNVTIGATGNWPTHANDTTTVSDGVNTMVLYFWASSYATIGAMGGSAIPTGPVNVDGFVDFFAASSEAEFVATSITPVPEPTALSLCGGIGSLLAWVGYRLRKKS